MPKPFSPILTPVSKAVDKLWRIEKKMLSFFQQFRTEEWPVRLNLGSIQEVSQRADIAKEILQRAMERKRRSLNSNRY